MAKKPPAAMEEEQPYAEYRVRFFENRVQAEIVSGIERLSMGKMQRSLRFLFKEYGQIRRKMHGHLTLVNQAQRAVARDEAIEKGQFNATS